MSSHLSVFAISNTPMILNCTVYSFPSPVRLTVYTLFTIIHQILGRQVVEEHLSAVGSNLAPLLLLLLLPLLLMFCYCLSVWLLLQLNPMSLDAETHDSV